MYYNKKIKLFHLPVLQQKERIMLQFMLYEMAVHYVPPGLQEQATSIPIEPKGFEQPRFSSVERKKVLEKSTPLRSRLFSNSHGKRGRKPKKYFKQ